MGRDLALGNDGGSCGMLSGGDFRLKLLRGLGAPYSVSLG
jgi:hypothetical protein